MSEPLSFKELEKLVKDLKSERQVLTDELLLKEQQIQSRESLYHLIINHSPEGILIIQGESIKFINQTALKFIEASREDAEALVFSNILHPDFKGQIIQYFAEIIDGTRVTLEMEAELITLKGIAIAAKIYCEKVSVSLNNQASLLIKFENIQAIKTKEREDNNLRKALDFFDQHLSEGILLLERAELEDNSLFLFRVEDANTAATNIIEKPKNQMVGMLLNELMNPDYLYQLPKNFDQSFTDVFELYIKNLKKHLQFNLYAISQNHVACKIADITDFFQTKEQLNKNLQRNELFTEIISIFNSDIPYKEKFKLVIDRVAYHFNPKRILIINNSEDYKKGELFIQYAHKDFEPFSNNFIIQFDKVPSWNRMLKERKMILGFALQYLPEDMQTYLKSLQMRSAYIFPVVVVENSLYGSIVFESHDKVEWDNTEINYLKMVSVLITNLTSRKNYEDKLLKSKEKAEEADRLKSSFLANMSHDIRIPMTAIIGFSDLLADPDLTLGEREEFIELISKSGQDLLTLIDNIVDVAKIETGQLRLNREKYQLSTFFKELYSSHNKDSKIIERDDLELVIDFKEKYQKFSIETDIFRFKQVFSNLIDNAIKFTERGVIHFGVSNSWANTIEFYVQDTGIGIAEGTQDVIFERFSKIDRSYTKEYNGTGLGLAICKSLVELMGGEIRVISYPGKGSTFYFTHPLPAGIQEKLLSKAKLADESSKIFNGKHILIAEDVEQNYRLLDYILQPTNASIKWAKNGLEALEYVAECNPVDVILMDIRMPVMNGIEATKEILKLRKIPIIAQTAYIMGDEKELAINAGCINYLTKPIHAANLIKILEGILLPNPDDKVL